MAVFIDKSGRAAEVRGEVSSPFDPNWTECGLPDRSLENWTLAMRCVCNSCGETRRLREKRVGAWRCIKPALVEYPSVNVGRSRVC